MIKKYRPGIHTTPNQRTKVRQVENGVTQELGSEVFGDSVYEKQLNKNASYQAEPTPSQKGYLAGYMLKEAAPPGPFPQYNPRGFWDDKVPGQEAWRAKPKPKPTRSTKTLKLRAPAPAYHQLSPKVQQQIAEETLKRDLSRLQKYLKTMPKWGPKVLGRALGPAGAAYAAADMGYSVGEPLGQRLADPIDTPDTFYDKAIQSAVVPKDIRAQGDTVNFGRHPQVTSERGRLLRRLRMRGKRRE
jgi:hypothetical protein